jgi:hypothetical protein
MIFLLLPYPELHKKNGRAIPCGVGYKRKIFDTKSELHKMTMAKKTQIEKKLKNTSDVPNVSGETRDIFLFWPRGFEREHERGTRVYTGGLGLSGSIFFILIKSNCSIISS